MVDLHLHSNFSDGKLSIEELAEKIKSSGVSHFSLTDHDSIDGLAGMKKIMADSGIVFINGVEFSIIYKQQEIHVLLYDFDIKKIAAVLDERNKIVGKKRLEELAMATDLFKQEGFLVGDVTLTDRRPVGLLIALDIYNNEKNRESITKKHGKLLNEKEFYDYYQAPGKCCYVPKSGVDLDWLLLKLKNIQCDKILAHPFVPVSFLVKPLKEEEINELIDIGLAGIEIYHGNNTDDQIDFLKQYVDGKNLLFTGGSDYHGKNNDVPIGFYNKDQKVPGFRLTNYCF